MAHAQNMVENDPPRWWDLCFAAAEAGGTGNYVRWCWIGLLAAKEGVVRFLETRTNNQESGQLSPETQAAPAIDAGMMMTRTGRRSSGITLL